MHHDERSRDSFGGALLAGLGLSALAYAFGMAHDVASARGVARVKPPLFIAMVATHIASLLRLASAGPRLPVPGALAKLSGVLAVAGFLGMFYSIMVEIPLKKAWLKQGHTDELVTTGTYALVRHPGVLWLTAALPFAAVAARSRGLLLGWPAIILGDAVHVWFQERAVLPRVFGEAYREYQHSTPFLIPSRRSLRRVWRAVRERLGAWTEAAREHEAHADPSRPQPS